MIRSIINAAIVIGVGLTACTDQRESQTPTLKATNVNQKTEHMENLVSIVEIPTNNFARAQRFYQAILGVQIEEVSMDGVKMGVFPGNGETVNVALVNGNDYKPSPNGPIVYLNAGKDLQITLEKVKSNGGKIVVPKTEISPEMGFFAMFIDTEGNKLGLHSSN